MNIFIVFTNSMKKINEFLSATLWGSEWVCANTNLEFCALEGMCNYQGACPMFAGEFAGRSWDPSSMVTITDSWTNEAYNATWEYL